MVSRTSVVYNMPNSLSCHLGFNHKLNFDLLRHRNVLCTDGHYTYWALVIQLFLRHLIKVNFISFSSVQYGGHYTFSISSWCWLALCTFTTDPVILSQLQYPQVTQTTIHLLWQYKHVTVLLTLMLYIWVTDEWHTNMKHCKLPEQLQGTLL